MRHGRSSTSSAIAALLAGALAGCGGAETRAPAPAKAAPPEGARAIARPVSPAQAVTDAALDEALRRAYEAGKAANEGKNADYIPALAKVDAKLFGLAVVTVDGRVKTIGDVDSAFSIQSISKVFTLCRVLEEGGPDLLRAKVGVDATGLPFNAVMAIELLPQRSVNPFVNAGAMATTSLLAARTPEERWAKVKATLDAFAGRALGIDEEVYRSEAATNQHNVAIARLLESYGRFYADVPSTVDVYTRQCSVAVTAKDLAVMAATLANGGVQPVTGARLLAPENAQRVGAVMATAGLYDAAGTWLWEVGLPAKSGVGGGIIAFAPGRMGIAAFAPPLDAAGNSVRAQAAIRSLSASLGLNLFGSRPAAREASAPAKPAAPPVPAPTAPAAAPAPGR